MRKGAIISPDGLYRYLLWREWGGTHDHKDGPCVFVMLNPSTANATIDDPTIRRCVAFAKKWRYSRLEVVNLFAYRTSSPKKLLALYNINEMTGPDNHRYVTNTAAGAGIVVCAWGNHGKHQNQDKRVREWLWPGEVHALGFTKSGQPKHPLFLPSNTELVRF